MNIEVNWVAVVVAAIVSMAIGFAWYSKAVFGGPWMKLKGYTEESLKAAQKEMGKLYGLSLIAAIITAFVLTHMIALSESFYQLERLQTALTTAFWVWLGFVMPVQLVDEIFGEKKWMLFAINTGYQLVALLGMGIALALIV